MKASERSYLGRDMMVASELWWLRGWLSTTSPDVRDHLHRKIDSALAHEQRMRDELCDFREALVEIANEAEDNVTTIKLIARRALDDR